MDSQRADLTWMLCVSEPSVIPKKKTPTQIRSKKKKTKKITNKDRQKKNYQKEPQKNPNTKKQITIHDENPYFYNSSLSPPFPFYHHFVFPAAT